MSWKNMKNDTTFVRMRRSDRLGDAKMSKKGTSLLSWSLASSFTIFRCNSCTPTSLVVYTHSTQTSLLSRIHTTSTLPYLDTILHSHITCSRPPMAQTLSFKYRCIFFHLHFLLHFLFHSLYFFIDLHLTINYFYMVSEVSDSKF